MKSLKVLCVTATLSIASPSFAYFGSVFSDIVDSGSSVLKSTLSTFTDSNKDAVTANINEFLDFMKVKSVKDLEGSTPSQVVSRFEKESKIKVSAKERAELEYALNVIYYKRASTNKAELLEAYQKMMSFKAIHMADSFVCHSSCATEEALKDGIDFVVRSVNSEVASANKKVQAMSPAQIKSRVKMDLRKKKIKFSESKFAKLSGNEKKLVALALECQKSCYGDSKAYASDLISFMTDDKKTLSFDYIGLVDPLINKNYDDTRAQLSAVIELSSKGKYFQRQDSFYENLARKASSNGGKSEKEIADTIEQLKKQDCLFK